jgi:hypothetical protein
MGFDHIWKMLPALKDIPAEMLRSLPLSTVLQLNDALARETRSKRLMDADAKLQHNAESLNASPTRVEAGVDNRAAYCTKQDSWVEWAAVPKVCG